jgi:predicted dehydrogenase
MTKPLNLGMIGYGFMGRAHSNGYRKVNNFFDLEYRPVLKAACARDEAKVKKFADTWGYESVETDWRKLIARKDIDVIDICTPNNTHAEIALAAAAAGKMILCEKPLAMNAPEGLKMVQAVEKAKVPNMVWYNYRRVPAVMLAKKLVDEGRLGKVFHYRAKAAPAYGGSTWRRPAAASPAICSPTASIPPCGSTARSRISRP